MAEYQRYYRERMEAVRNGGVFYFDEAAGREIYLVTPSISSTWPRDTGSRQLSMTLRSAFPILPV